MNLKLFFTNLLKVILSDYSKVIISFLSIIYLTQILSTEEFGTYGLILSYASITSILALNTSNNKIIINLVAEKDIISRKLFNNVLILRISSIFFSIIFLIFLSIFTNLNIFNYLNYIVLIVLSIVFWDFAESFAFGILEFNNSVLLNISSNIIFVLILYIFFDDINFSYVLLTYCLIYGFRSVIYFFLANKHVSDKHHSSNYKISEILKLSYPYLITRFCSGIAEHSPIIFLGLFISNDEVAFYNLSNKLILPLVIGVTSILRLVYPYLTRMIKDNRKYIINIFSKYYSLLMFLISSIIFVVSSTSDFWILKIFGSKYINSIPVFKLLSWVVVFYVFDIIFSNMLSAFNKQHLSYRVTIFDCLIVIPLIFIGSMYDSLILTQLKLIGYLITFIIHIYLYQKYLKINLLSSTFFINTTLILILLFISFYPISFFTFSIFMLISLSFTFINFKDLKHVIVNFKIN